MSVVIGCRASSGHATAIMDFTLRRVCSRCRRDVLLAPETAKVQRQNKLCIVCVDCFRIRRCLGPAWDGAFETPLAFQITPELRAKIVSREIG